ncbi:MAG: tyrosine-type recombinase/integrase [Prevotella sp.]|nr:tyrosine-type recombinase/integrase [Prevotella sp.]
MGTPVFKLIFDRRGRASKTKEGAIELRITYNRIQKHATTGVRVLPRQWKNGFIINRIDAAELQAALDHYVSHARKVVNEQMERGTLDMDTIVSLIGNKQKQQASEHVPERRLLMDYFRERAAIRKFGRTTDSQERYDRFLRWFEQWGGMVYMEDITPQNIIKMDEALSNKHLGKDKGTLKKAMTPYSKWNNYHRFLNSFILDAMDDGLMQRNPYKSLHIHKEQTSGAIDKCLTREELSRIERMEFTVDYLRHARDLFVFQTYTCLSYTDLEAFDAAQVQEVNGRMVYKGKRGKTDVEYTFLLMEPARRVLEMYGGQLPMMSNQKYNQYLKMIATMAGITKPMSSHWARHTGATLLLNSGVDMEIVSRILGHSSTKMTRQVYAKMLDTTVADAMAAVESRLVESTT